MKYSRTCGLFICLLAIIACNKSTPVSQSATFEGFEEISIPQSSFKKLVRKDAEGKKLEEGTILDGQKNGTWITYNVKDGYIETTTSFIDGKKEGLYMKFNNRLQIDEKAFYVQDQYHGQRGLYKFGRPLEEMEYVDNKLHGTKFIYHTNSKVQQEINFKNGLQDGIYRYFDDKGVMTLDYVYQDGEKISGGMVEK